MPPKGWRKVPPKVEPLDAPSRAELRKRGPANPMPKVDDSSDDKTPVVEKPSRPEETRKSVVPDSEEPSLDEGEFVTEQDVKKMASLGQPPSTDKTPGEKGFIAELVAGAGQKLHEVEYGIFNHPVFIHTPADERIWSALGRYAESQLDPTKYGIVILLVVLVGSESMKLAVYGKFRADQSAREKRLSK